MDLTLSPAPERRVSDNRWTADEVWPAIFLFACYALLQIAGTYLSPLFEPASPVTRVLGWMLAAAVVPLPLAGVCLAFFLGRPRWIYLYAGWLVAAVSLATMILSGQALGVLIAPAAALAACAALPPLRGLLLQAWRDPTLLSLAAYGWLPFVILIAFDDANPNNITGYQAFAVLLPLAGVWLYAHAGRSWQRFLALWLTALAALFMGLLDVNQLGATRWPRTVLDGAYAAPRWILYWMFNMTVLLMGPALLAAVQRRLRPRARQP